MIMNIIYQSLQNYLRKGLDNIEMLKFRGSFPAATPCGGSATA